VPREYLTNLAEKTKDYASAEYLVIVKEIFGDTFTSEKVGKLIGVSGFDVDFEDFEKEVLMYQAMGYSKEDFSAFNPVADSIESFIGYVERAGSSRIDLRPL
jgi:hypothetical protein